METIADLEAKPEPNFPKPGPETPKVQSSQIQKPPQLNPGTSQMLESRNPESKLSPQTNAQKTCYKGLNN